MPTHFVQNILQSCVWKRELLWSSVDDVRVGPLVTRNVLESSQLSPTSLEAGSPSPILAPQALLAHEELHIGAMDKKADSDCQVRQDKQHVAKGFSSCGNAGRAVVAPDLEVKQAKRCKSRRNEEHGRSKSKDEPHRHLSAAGSIASIHSDSID